MIRSRAVFVGLSLGGRAAFFLALSALVYARAEPTAAVAFFQLMFLQAVVITFLSASGYFRALNTTEDATGKISLLAAHLVLAGLSLLALPPMLIWGGALYPSVSVLLLVWGGAVAAALSGPLTGLTLASRGPARAFGPQAVLAVLCAVAAFHPIFGGRLGPYLLVAVFQGATMLWLAAQNAAVVRGAAAQVWRGGLRQVFDTQSATLAYGAINTGTLSVVFIFREIWSMSAPPALVAAAFFALRFSDTLSQGVMLVMARHALLARMADWLAGRGMVLLAAALVLQLAAIDALASGSISMPLVFAFAALAVTDLSRLPINLVFLLQIGRERPQDFAVYALATPLLAFGATAALGGIPSPGGIFTYLALSATIGAIISGWQIRRDRRVPGAV